MTPDTQAQFDPFQSLDMGGQLNLPATAQYNPYLEDNSNMANNGGAYYQPQPTYTVPQQPVSYSLDIMNFID